MCQIFASQDPAGYEPETRRLRLNGQSTSIRLEAAFWTILDGIAEDEGYSTPGFISKLHDEVLRRLGTGSTPQPEQQTEEQAARPSLGSSWPSA